MNTPDQLPDSAATAARGLHDGIAQGLNFLNLQLQMLDASLRAGRQQEAADIVPLLRAGVQDCYGHLRALLQIFPNRPHDVDLDSALRMALQRFRAETGLEASFAAGADPGPPLAPAARVQVLFIVHEALSNIRRHAGATSVRVCAGGGRDFSLSISDNGVGFDPAAMSASAGQQLGLRAMRERARHINGELAIDSRPGLGTTVHLRLARAQPGAA